MAVRDVLEVLGLSERAVGRSSKLDLNGRGRVDVEQTKRRRLERYRTLHGQTTRKQLGAECRHNMQSSEWSS